MNIKNVSAAGLVPLALLLTGCSVFDQSRAAPNQVTMDSRAKANDAQKIESYFNKINPTQARLTRVDRGAERTAMPSRPVRLTIEQALSKYVPKEYKVTTDPDVDVAAYISYDPSTSWVEALGKSFADVGIEMDANMYKKLMFIRAFQTSLLEIVEKYVPAEYEVFIDAGIDADAQVRYDTSQHWVEALSKGAAESGIDVTANITKKIVLMKPLVKSNTVTKSIISPASKGKVAARTSSSN